MSTVIVKLAAVSICPCGEPMLHDNIALGTEYRVYTETIRRGFVYVCGKCGEFQHDVAVIEADNRNGIGRAPLPLALFDLILVAA
jgi:hypothetical protein